MYYIESVSREDFYGLWCVTARLNVITHTHTHTPVSYTHLDVYKRQHTHTAAYTVSYNNGKPREKIL